MPRKYRTPAPQSRNRYLEQQAAYAEAAIVTEGEPATGDPPEYWAAWIQAAQGKAAEAVIEWGRRIAVAHAAYSAQPQQWGRTWDDWCQQNLQIGKRYADQLRLIGENLGGTDSRILPAATHQLTSLAKLRQVAPDVFEQAVASGAISPGMSRADARALVAEVAPPSPAAPRRRSPLVSLQVEPQVAELVRERAQQEGLSVSHLLLELLAKP